MKHATRSRYLPAGAAALVVVALLSWVVACGGGGAAEEGGVVASPTADSPSTSPTAADSPVDAVALVVSSREESVELTLADVESLPPFTGWAGSRTQEGEVLGPDEYTGVTLAELADLVGGVARGYTVTVTAADGYSVELTDEQLAGEGFTTYDPATGDESPATQALTPVLVYRRNGSPLDVEADGALMLQVAQPQAGQVVDAKWAVKAVVTVEVLPGTSQ